MFTGLVREIGTITSLSPQSGITRIELSAPVSAPGLELGASLAVNGICLTVTRLTGSKVVVEAAAETRRLTTLRNWRTGDRVHLEPALRAGDPLGGHLVLGHVDGCGRVTRIRTSGRSRFLTISAPPQQIRFLLPKGSVSVNGVSLTVDEGPFTDRFTINVIPHTLAVTNLGRLRVGQQVNLEMDVMVKAARGDGMSAALGDLPSLASPNDDTRSDIKNGKSGKGSKWTLDKLLTRGFRRLGR